MHTAKKWKPILWLPLVLGTGVVWAEGYNDLVEKEPKKTTTTATQQMRGSRP